MRTIIIPSNGNPAVIEQTATLLNLFGGEAVNFIFLNISSVSLSVRDGRLQSAHRNIRSGFNSEFCEAVQKFSDAGQHRTAITDQIFVDRITGFRNYVQTLGANLVIFDRSQWRSHPDFSQDDIFKMVMHCDCEILYISANTDCSGNKALYKGKNNKAAVRAYEEVAA